MEIAALLVIIAFLIGSLVVVSTNATNNMRSSYDQIREAELSLRTHLQAQVDDLHGKLLSHDWAEYSNTVGQRSAFDRMVAAEELRQPVPLGDNQSIDDFFSEQGERYDAMEGPTVG